ncbi:hypothetical protein QOZ80_1AG0032350 [Eleusine coracana subsp. coracana]|nr:hypothetical protein QOZ80_1AG0032350 [Eleusine coracana subsp. coracana]
MDQTVSHPLPDVGSFSYSWPTSKPEPQLDARVHHNDVAAFTGTGPALSPQCSFDFRPPLPEHSASMADADKMFLDGLLLPLQPVSRGGKEDGVTGHEQPMLLRSLSLDSSQRMMVSASKRHQLSRPASLNSSPSGYPYEVAAIARSPSMSKGAVFMNNKLRFPYFGRSGKQHKWNPFRYLKFLVPLYQKIVSGIRRSKADTDSHRAESCNRHKGSCSTSSTPCGSATNFNPKDTMTFIFLLPVKLSVAPWPV